MDRFGDRTRFLLRGLLTKATPRGRWSSWGGWLWRLRSPGNEQIQDHTANAHNGDRRGEGGWESGFSEFLYSERTGFRHAAVAGRPPSTGGYDGSAIGPGF